MSRKKELKTSIKDELQKMLESNVEPSEGRMKLLTLGIKYLAVEAKLEESEYGGFFEEESNGKHGDSDFGRPINNSPKRKKPGTRRDEGDDDSGFLDSGEGSLPS